MNRLNNKYKSIFCFLMVSVLSGCEQVSGKMDVHHPLMINNKKGQEVVIPVGIYDSKIKIKRDGMGDLVRIRTDIRVASGHHEKFEIKIPGSIKIPKEDYRFRLPSSDIEQHFDIDGRVESKFGPSSKPYYFYRECMMPDREYETGVEEVEAHTEKVSSHVYLQFKSGDATELALLSFIAKQGEREVEDKVSECHPAYYYGGCCGPYNWNSSWGGRSVRPMPQTLSVEAVRDSDDEIFMPRPTVIE